jgi:hypothetical protein
MNKKTKAKKLRKQGLLYREIGEVLGVSGTMARRYVNDIKSQRPVSASRENAPFACNKRRPGHAERCARQAGHSGTTHLANRNKKLIWWEQ